MFATFQSFDLTNESPFDFVYNSACVGLRLLDSDLIVDALRDTASRTAETSYKLDYSCEHLMGCEQSRGVVSQESQTPVVTGVTFSETFADILSDCPAIQFGICGEESKPVATTNDVVKSGHSRGRGKRVTNQNVSDVSRGTFSIEVDLTFAVGYVAPTPLKLSKAARKLKRAEDRATKEFVQSTEVLQDHRCVCSGPNGSRTRISRGVHLLESIVWYRSVCELCRVPLYPNAEPIRRGADHHQREDRGQEQAKPTFRNRKGKGGGRAQAKSSLNKVVRNGATTAGVKRKHAPVPREPINWTISDSSPGAASSKNGPKVRTTRVYPVGDCGLQTAYNIYRKYYGDVFPNEFEATLAQALKADKTLPCSWMCDSDLDKIFRALRISCVVVSPIDTVYKDEPTKWMVHYKLGNGPMVTDAAVHLVTFEDTHYTMMNLYAGDSFVTADRLTISSPSDLSCLKEYWTLDDAYLTPFLAAVRAPHEFAEATKKEAAAHTANFKQDRASFVRMRGWQNAYAHLYEGDSKAARIMSDLSMGTFGKTDQEFELIMKRRTAFRNGECESPELEEEIVAVVEEVAKPVKPAEPKVKMVMFQGKSVTEEVYFAKIAEIHTLRTEKLAALAESRKTLHARRALAVKKDDKRHESGCTPAVVPEVDQKSPQENALNTPPVHEGEACDGLGSNPEPEPLSPALEGSPAEATEGEPKAPEEVKEEEKKEEALPAEPEVKPIEETKMEKPEEEIPAPVTAAESPASEQLAARDGVSEDSGVKDLTHTLLQTHVDLFMDIDLEELLAAEQAYERWSEAMNADLKAASEAIEEDVSGGLFATEPYDTEYTPPSIRAEEDSPEEEVLIESDDEDESCCEQEVEEYIPHLSLVAPLPVQGSLEAKVNDLHGFAMDVIAKGFEGKWEQFVIKTVGDFELAEARDECVVFKEARAQRNILVRECFRTMYQRQRKFFPNTRIYLNSFKSTLGKKVPFMNADKLDYDMTSVSGIKTGSVETWMLPSSRVRQNSISIERSSFDMDPAPGVDMRVEAYKIVEATLEKGISGYATIVEWVPIDLTNENHRVEIISRVQDRMVKRMRERDREGIAPPSSDEYRKILMALLTRESGNYRKIVQRLPISCEIVAQLTGNPKIFMFDCKDYVATEKRVSAYLAGVVAKLNISKYAAINGEAWVQNSAKAAVHLMACNAWRTANCDKRKPDIRRGQAHYLVGYHTDEKKLAAVTVKPSLHMTSIKQPTTSRLDRKPSAVGSGMECLGAVRPHADCMDAISVADGVKGRIGREPPKPEDDTHFDQLRLYTKAFVRAHGWADMMKVNFEESRLDTADFLSRTPYTQQRKDELQAVSDEHIALGCANYADIADEHYRKIVTLVDQFSKDEHYDDWKLPRLINARGDIFKVVFGPWVKMIEDVVYEHEGCVKHIPVKDRPAYIMEMLEKDGLIYYATDWSCMEAHNHALMMNAIMCTVIEEMCFGIPFWKNLFAMLEDLKGLQTMRFRFFTVLIMATVMSGEMWTALINFLTNIINVNFFLEKEGFITGIRFFNGNGMIAPQEWLCPVDQGIRIMCNRALAFRATVLSGQPRGDPETYAYSSYTMKRHLIPGVYEGDDSLLALDCRWPRLSAEHFAKYGLIMKLSFEENLNEASFCGLVFDREAKASLTNPMKYLCKGFLARKYAGASQGKKNSLMRATALSLLNCYPACPVLADYCRAILAMTRGADPRYVLKDKHLDLYERARYTEALSNTRWDDIVEPITMGSRVVVEKVFGVPLAAQYAMESYFKSLLTKTAPEVMIVPCMDLCVPQSWLDNWNEYVYYGVLDHNNVPIIVNPNQAPLEFPVSTSTYTGAPTRS